MNVSRSFRHLARGSASPAELFQPLRRPILRNRTTCVACHQRALSSRSALPRILQPSLWRSMVPTFLRRRSKPAPGPPGTTSTSHTDGSRGRRKTEWNPATAFILYGLLIGSQAIQNLTLRQQAAAFGRVADARIALLREVIGRLQKGEEVDVEGLLGTGVPEREKEWEDVMREIEEEEALFTKWRKERSQPGGEDSTPEGEMSTG